MTEKTYKPNNLWINLITLTLYICLVFYPLWYFPKSAAFKLLLGNVILLIILLINLILRKINSNRASVIQQDEAAVKHKIFDLPLTLILIFIIVSHIVPLTYPITTFGDQHFMAGIGATLVNIISSKLPEFLNIHLISGVSALVLLFFVFYLRKRTAFFLNAKVMFGFVVGVFAASNLYFYAAAKSGAFDSLNFHYLFRYTPLYVIIPSAFFSLFGIGTVQANIQALFFHIGTVIIFYNTVKIYRNRLLAASSAGFLAVIPTVFFYAGQCLNPAGLMFFVMCAAFYLIRYRNKNNFSDFTAFLFFLIAGFMYKNEMVFAIGGFLAFLFFCLIRSFFGEKLKLRLADFLLTIAVVFLTVIFYMFLFYISPLPKTNYGMVPANFTDPHILLYLVNTFIKDTSVFMFIFFMLGLILQLFKKTDELFRLLLTVFACYYIMVTGQNIYFATRMFFPAYLFYALCGGFGLLTVIKIFSKRASVQKYVIIFLIFSGFLNLSFDVKNDFKLRYKNIGSYEYSSAMFNHIILPYDKLFSYIKTEISNTSEIKIFAPMICEPSHFYFIVYGIPNSVIYSRKYDNKETLDDKFFVEIDFDIESFYNYLTGGRYDYVVIPKTSHAKIVFGDTVAAYLTSDNLSDPRFKPVQTFSFYGNTLLLFEVD